MAYHVMNRDEFQNYLQKKVKVIPTKDEMLIDEFSSTSLFELYELLTKLKDDRQIALTYQKKLKEKVQANFSNVACLFEFPINENVLTRVENYIKNVFLAYLKDPENSILSEKEFEKLKIVIAKKYPHEFVKLMQEERNATELKLQKKLLDEIVSDVTDDYHKHLKNLQNNEDIQTAYYTDSTNQFSKAHIATTGRLKAFKAANDNLRKEVTNSIQRLIPSNLEKGITYEDLKKQFNLSKVSDDYFGFTVYVTDIDDTFHIDEKTLKTKEGKEFVAYRKQKEDNIPIYRSLNNFLHNPCSFLTFTEEQYLQLKIELLNILQHLTYPECSEEYNGLLFHPQDENDPGTSFSKLLASSLQTYHSCLQNNSFKQKLNFKEHANYQEELLSLFEEFRSRMNDKLEFAALKIMVPQLLNDKNFMHENILRDQLDVKVLSIEPKLKGRRGFVALFAILQAPDGRKLEGQFLSYSRYKGSKSGNFAHSKMQNKQLDISPFFELKDEFKDCENDEDILKNAIHILNTTTIAQKNYLLTTPSGYLSKEQLIHKKNLELALQTIQIKEHYQDSYFILKKDKNGSYREIEKVSKEYSLKTYLPIFAQYHSPRLIAVSSPHSRVNKNTAFVNIKTLIDNFRDVLLVTDETTCLSDMLLKRLEEIQKEDPYVTLHQSTLRSILSNNNIPEEQIEHLMQQMTQYSRTIRLPYTNSVSDIKERVEEENANEK